MPESLSPELLQLRQRAEQFANSVLLPSQAELADGRADLAAVRGIVTRAAVDAGFFKMTQPKSFGGSEAGLLYRLGLRWLRLMSMQSVPLLILCCQARIRNESAMRRQAHCWRCRGCLHLRLLRVLCYPTAAKLTNRPIAH